MEMALDQLSERKVVDLDPERRVLWRELRDARRLPQSVEEPAKSNAGAR
jgi:hypothetical protein